MHGEESSWQPSDLRRVQALALARNKGRKKDIV
jgi:hypothetical protein